MTSALTVAACVWCGSVDRTLTRDSDGDLMCSDERLCGTASATICTPTRRPAVTATVAPRPRLTLGQLSDEAEAAALTLLVVIRRSRREGHRGTREVVEAQDRSRATALDYHRATAGTQAARGAR